MLTLSQAVYFVLLVNKWKSYFSRKLDRNGLCYVKRCELINSSSIFYFSRFFCFPVSLPSHFSMLLLWELPFFKFVIELEQCLASYLICMTLEDEQVISVTCGIVPLRTFSDSWR